MRIALTGGTGFIGQCLLRSACAEHEFVAFTPSADDERLFRSDAITYVSIQRAGHTGASPDSDAGRYPGIESCDAAINLGFARPKPGASETFGEYVPSICAADAFFSACLKAGITNIVHVSTRSVYGLHMPLPHTEDEAIAPFSLYGAAKAAAEALALAYNQKDGASIKVLRLAQIIGRNEYQGVVSASMRALGEGRPLQIWGTGTEAAREYLYVRDACEALVRALKHPDQKGVFNIGTGCMTTVEELMQILADLYADEGARIERHPEKTVPEARTYMDVSKARDLLGWQARWPLPQALAAMRADAEGLY